MRSIAIIGCVLLTFAAARAEDLTNRNVADAHRPSAAEVILQLYQFDLFQQNAVDRTDAAAPSDLSTKATARADAALKRDRALDELRQRIGADSVAMPKGATMRAQSLAAVDRTDGPAYVRKFYAAQLAEYEITVELLEQYLQQPDNADVQSFAEGQLPVLRAELSDIRSALAEK